MDRTRSPKWAGLLVIIITLFACSTFGPENTCDFITTQDIYGTESHSWQAAVPSSGIHEFMGAWVCIFMSATSYNEGTTFRDYIFLRVPTDSEGFYEDSETYGISFYDHLGYFYQVYSSDTNTYLNTSIVEWSRNRVEGVFEGVLRNFDTGLYLSISGHFRTFES